MDTINANILPSISLIVPTYQEADGIDYLIDRVSEVRLQNNLVLEMLIIDDDSQDGIEEKIAQRNLDWIKLFVRTKDRGLSYAVVYGMQQSNNDICVVMDADLSHPPEKIPELAAAINSGFDFALGSRYVKGGSTADNWGLLRWINSRAATLMALPFTTLSDPMSGFFAIHRSTFENADELNPIGYKIGLEIVVKGRCKKTTEVPIHFENRVLGESKLTLVEQLRYIKHIRRLFTYKYGTLSHLLQFLIVGVMGMAVNLVALTALMAMDIGLNWSIGNAIFISMIFNFVLNRRFTFAYARSQSMVKQFFGFMAACSVGAIVNYSLTVTIIDALPTIVPQIAAAVGIVAGAGINFLFNRFAVFKYEHYKE